MTESSNVIVRVNSEERVSPFTTSSSNFKVQFNSTSELSNINRVVIKQISIPNVQYNIKLATPAHLATNVFSYFTASPQSFSIVPGYYDINQLITALQVGGASIGLTVTLNQVTKKLQFTTTTPITYLSEGNGNGMAPILGILANSPSLVTAFNAPNLPNLSVHPNVYVASAALSDGSHMVSPTLGSLPVCAVVPINTGFGNIIQYTTVQEHLDDIHYLSYMNGKPLQTLDFQLYDGDANLLDLQGLNWTIVFKAYQAPV